MSSRYLRLLEIMNLIQLLFEKLCKLLLVGVVPISTCGPFLCMRGGYEILTKSKSGMGDVP